MTSQQVLERPTRPAEPGVLGLFKRLFTFAALFALFAIAGLYAVAILPRDPFGWASWIVIAASALAAGLFALSQLDGRPLGALGFPLGAGAARQALLGIAIGGALLAAVALVLFLTGGARFVPDEGGLGGYLAHIGVTFAFFWIAAAAEELLFRGYPFQALVAGVGVWPAVLLASALFSLLHGSNPNVTAPAFANIFLAGVWLSWVYLRTRSLWVATGAHAGWNWTMAALLDFPVSGLTGFDTPLYSVVETGADWYTGGAFGPEAGVVGTALLLAAVVWTVRTPRLRPAPEIAALDPLVEARLRAVRNQE